MNHTIVPLPREQWQDAVLPIGDTTPNIMMYRSKEGRMDLRCPF